MKKYFFILFLILVSQQSFADSDIKSLENISEELVTIRQQIETLHNKISFEKEAYKDQMRSYANQKSDLNVRISRTELNNKDLQRELKKLSDINLEKNQGQTLIVPVLKKAIREIRADVTTSLPFKLQQRLQALDDIEHRLEANIISPNKAANQLWAFVEDEFMLGKTSGLYNDTVTIEGQDKLVKVLRIGKIAMFFKTPDEHYGVTRKHGEKWQQTMLNEQDNVTQLEKLFDSFSKNIRSGQFATPNFLPKS